MIHISVPARVGLAGNPSDGYGGRAVAAAITGFEALVTIAPAAGVRIASDRERPLISGSLRALLDQQQADGCRSHRLALACCRLFMRTSIARGWLPALPPDEQGFVLSTRCDIPYRVGLAGSSAITVAILRALSARFEVAIPDADLPALALAVETEEMGIHGGLMDRVVQVYGGLLYMDLSEPRVRDTGRGIYTALPVDRLPALFIAWRPDLAAGSEGVHNPLRKRVATGDSDALRLLEELAELADAARRVLLSGSAGDLAPIMDANFELRARLVDVGDGNRQLVEIGRRLGAGVKQAGSGGAVVGAYDGNPDRGVRLRDAYRRVGARFAVPAVWMGPTGGSTGNGVDPRNSPPGDQQTREADFA